MNPLIKYLEIFEKFHYDDELRELLELSMIEDIKMDESLDKTSSPVRIISYVNWQHIRPLRTGDQRGSISIRGP